jgi:hypothetical protein
MPRRRRRLECDEGVLGGPGGDRHERIQAAVTWTFKNDLLRGLILYQEKEWVKFNKSIIIKSDFVSGQ